MCVKRHQGWAKGASCKIEAFKNIHLFTSVHFWCILYLSMRKMKKEITNSLIRVIWLVMTHLSCQIRRHWCQNSASNRLSLNFIYSKTPIYHFFTKVTKKMNAKKRFQNIFKSTHKMASMVRQGCVKGASYR